MFKNVLMTALMVSASFLQAKNVADDFVLDPAPRFVRGVVETDAFSPFEFFRLDAANDLEKAIGFQTPVKSQGGRGTCSIFSAAAEVESLLKIRDGVEYDLSENYLEYLVMSRIKSNPSEGSDTDWNIPAFQRYGAIHEATWPYETEDWTSQDLSLEIEQKAQGTCGHLSGKNQKACLLGHMDPTNDRFARDAAQTAKKLGTAGLRFTGLGGQNEVKQALNNSEPLVLGVRFFYKAWNHRKMEEYGLGKRDMDSWGKGVVSTPTAQDVQISSQHPAGHSIVVVGYDDARRVYFFKNSWGTGNFGENSDLLGNNTTDGYGTITYDYAHRYGTFHRVWFQ